MKNKIIVCTAKFSDNLGDGVISDCVEYLLKQHHPNIIVDCLDVSGRIEYQTSKSKNSSLIKQLFFYSPEFIRPCLTLIALFLIFKPKIKKEIQRIDFSECRLLIFGGGQLINNVALNFPLKIAYIAKMARKYGLNYSFNSVGVGQKKSFLSKRLFNSVFDSTYLKSIYLRDNESLSEFKKTYISVIEPQLSIDSGLWAKECYAPSSKIIKTKEELADKQGASNKIGVGISHPKELSVHMQTRGGDASVAAVYFWVSLIKKILKQGYQPFLFTNGSNDDDDFMQLVVEQARKENILDKITVCGQFYTPNELVDGISTFSGLVSHRLHANIIAHSFNIPSIALNWDDKVKSYFKIIDREDWCLLDNATPEKIIHALNHAMKVGLDTNKIEKLKMVCLRNLNNQLELSV